MHHIFRHVAIISPADTHPAVREAVNAPTKACNCNYGDNYYGDQVCHTKPRG